MTRNAASSCVGSAPRSWVDGPSAHDYAIWTPRDTSMTGQLPG